MTAMSKRCWLLKTEPDCFSIQDLAAAPRQTTCWSGVRNFQARNFMRDDMAVGDRVLFYHSNAEPSAIVGTAVVVREGYPDHTAWDPKDVDHFDPKASPDNPIWQMVDIRLESIFDEPLPLPLLRDGAGAEADGAAAQGVAIECPARHRGGVRDRAGTGRRGEQIARCEIDRHGRNAPMTRLQKTGVKKTSAPTTGRTRAAPRKEHRQEKPPPGAARVS